MSIYQGNKKVSGISLEPDMQNSFRSLTETSTVSSDDEVIIKHGSTVYKGTLADVVKSVTQNSITGDTGLPASDSAVNDALTEYFIIREIRKDNVNFETGKGYLVITDDALIIPDGYSFFTVTAGTAHAGAIMLGATASFNIVNNIIYIPYYSTETRTSVVVINLILIKS